MSTASSTDLSMRWRFTPAIALASAVILLVMGVTLAFLQEQSYRAQKIREAGVQAEILAASVSAALAFNDDKTAQEYVDALKANPEIEAVGVYAPSGVLVADFYRDGSLPAPRNIALGPPRFEGNHLIVVREVVERGNRLGVVYMRAVTESLQRRLMRYAGIMLLVIMAALVLGVLGTAQGALTRANAELKDKADALAEANDQLHAEMQERANAEEALRQAHKMEAIGQLSGGIAHDFNNLIAVIKGNLQLLQRRLAAGRSDVDRYVDSANEGLNRAAALTQRILAFSRRQPLSPKPVDLSRLVTGMTELLRHSLGAAVQIETRLESDWWVMCDANQMENVILNLAINARDAMPEGGRLMIETANCTVTAASYGDDVSPGAYVRLSLRDTGMGMMDEVRAKAIDPFFTTKPPGRGTGLGLSMTFGYVRQSNGHLNIESMVGKGTTITIYMPRVARGDADTE